MWKFTSEKHVFIHLQNFYFWERIQISIFTELSRLDNLQILQRLWLPPLKYSTGWRFINQRKIKCNYQFINQWVTESLDHVSICMEGRQDLQKSIKSEHFNAVAQMGIVIVQAKRLWNIRMNVQPVEYFKSGSHNLWRI